MNELPMSHAAVDLAGDVNRARRGRLVRRVLLGATLALPMLAYAQSTGSAPGGLPVTEDIRTRVISLPMHPYLDATTQDKVIAAVKRFAR